MILFRQFGMRGPIFLGVIGWILLPVVLFSQERKTEKSESLRHAGLPPEQRPRQPEAAVFPVQARSPRRPPEGHADDGAQRDD